MFCNTIWTQNSISGDIKDEANQPVAYANILLLKKSDSTVVSGTSSDDFGKFTFNDIKNGNYILKTSFVGYKDNFKGIQVAQDLLLETIILIELIESLNEIELVFKKPTLKREVDRLVFNVEKTALSEGNMMEVLRSTPSVLVLDGSIMVKNTTPTVFINDRKVHLSSTELVELLEGTSASNIKAVEVITNPSARYDAESGVVLNIVMSKNLVTGYNGSVYSNYTQGVFPKLNHGTSHYFKSNRTDLFLNYSYNDQKIDRVTKEYINYPEEEWNTTLDRNTWSETHNIGFNLDHQINSKNTLAFAANILILPYFKYLTKGDTNISPAVNSTSFFNSINLSRDKKHNLGFDLDYTNKINEKTSLSFNTHYTNYDYYRKQKVNSSYFDVNNNFLFSTRFNTRSDQDTNIFTSQLDYSVNLSESTTLEFGTKFSNVKTESGIIHRDIIDGQEVLNTNNTNKFNYKENVFAGYLNFERNGDKFNVNVGLRAEQTDISGESSNGDINKQDYLEWFPTVSLGYQISEKVNSYFNYKRSLSRPNYSHLNPFVFYLNDNTIVTGNPNLQPVFSDYILIGTSINNMFTFEVYYRSYKNNIFELPLQDNLNNSITYTPLNIDRTTEFGIDFETYFDVSDSWSLYFGSSTYRYEDEGMISGENVKRDQWANYSILSNDFTFLKDKSLTASFTATYVGKDVQGLQTIDSRIVTDLSIKKTAFKGKGIFSLTFSDLFNQQDFFITTRFVDQNSRLYQNMDNRYVRFGFRYKFGNTKLSTNQRSTSREERNRLNNNN